MQMQEKSNTYYKKSQQKRGKKDKDKEEGEVKEEKKEYYGPKELGSEEDNYIFFRISGAVLPASWWMRSWRTVPSKSSAP